MNRMTSNTEPSPVMDAIVVSPELKVFAPIRPLWIKIGISIFGCGYLGALAAVIAMAHGSQEIKELADVVHKFMLLVMLVGMLGVFGGYRKFGFDYWRSILSRVIARLVRFD